MDLPAHDRFRPTRRPTRVVHIGDVPVGGQNPIRVQSMTTTFTWEVDKTLDQIERLERAGCEIVRVTVPTMKDAEALPAIRAGMKTRGLTVPIVADIHFSPKLALLAVEHVDKVRVNPGNFSDQKRFAQRTYTDAEYAQELTRVEEKFTPLVLRCKERGIPLRIGTNHGSLSDRIVNRFGDSPAGMVESALEFVRICRKHDYHDLIISMKASNTRVMVEAYRLLADHMAREDMDYPFHLGVTEAGDGDDARIKSAIGIGLLLQDGLGDTIRVSLTEDPVAEVPAGLAIARRAGPALPAPTIPPADDPRETVDPLEFTRRTTHRAEQGPANVAMGADQPVRVEADLGTLTDPHPTLRAVRALLGPAAGDRPVELLSLHLASPEHLAHLPALAAAIHEDELPVGLDLRLDSSLWSDPAALQQALTHAQRLTPLDLTPEALPALAAEVARHDERTLLLLRPHDDDPQQIADLVQAAHDAGQAHVAVALRAGDDDRALIPTTRRLAATLDARGLTAPLVLVVPATGDDGRGGLIDAATIAGGLLLDGLGDSLRLEGLAPARAVQLAYGFLQGARRRTTQTEYISCPGCGRTLFELEPVTQQIKERTAHLKGVKIAVMGCIVNGPGEMADADFGYVGWKPGKVNLYVGRACVVREVPEDDAPDRLVELIKEHGRWTEPAALPVG